METDDLQNVSIEEIIRIERFCARLATDSTRHIDARRNEEWSNLFAEDAELYAKGTVHLGRAAVLAYAQGTPSELATFHSISYLHIDVISETEAHGEIGMIAFVVPIKDGMAQAPELSPAVIGKYIDIYRKYGEGWRIAQRKFVPHMYRTA